MRYALLSVTTLAWALWFGGTISTFVFGWAFFRPVAPPHAVAPSYAVATSQQTTPSTVDPTPVRPPWSGEAANTMFHAFRAYEFVLAPVGLLVAGLAFVTYPSRWTLGLLAGLIGSFGMAIIFGLGFMPIMDGLRKQGMVGTEDFMWRHRQSMITLAVQALILLLTGTLIPGLARGAKPVSRESKSEDPSQLVA